MRYRTRLLRPPTCNPALVGDLCTVEVEVTGVRQDPEQAEPADVVLWTRVVQVRVTSAYVRRMAEAAARNGGRATDAGGGVVAKTMSGKGKV